LSSRPYIASQPLAARSSSRPWPPERSSRRLPASRMACEPGGRRDAAACGLGSSWGPLRRLPSLDQILVAAGSAREALATATRTAARVAAALATGTAPQKTRFLSRRVSKRSSVQSRAPPTHFRTKSLPPTNHSYPGCTSRRAPPPMARSRCKERRR